MTIKNMVCRVLAVMVLVLMIVPLTGCATILNDDHQMVAFASDPDGATVFVDGVPMGKTPCSLPIKRSGWDKQIRFEKPGYKTTLMTLDNRVGAAGFGNLILGGFVGIAIDAVSGRAGTYQDVVTIVMQPGSGTINLDSAESETLSPPASEPSTHNKFYKPSPSSSGTRRDSDWIVGKQSSR